MERRIAALSKHSSDQVLMEVMPQWMVPLLPLTLKLLHESAHALG
jgi:hypothetical protein